MRSTLPGTGGVAAAVELVAERLGRHTDMTRMRTLGTLGAVAITTLALTGCSGDDGGGETQVMSTQAAAETSDVPVITVNGHGTIDGTPDVLTINLGVGTRGDTAQAALEANNGRATLLIQTLKDAGVEAKDIQTSNLSIYPTFDEDSRDITGYVVDNMVTVRLRQLDSAGALIDAAAGAAGDNIRINGMAFSIDDTSDLVAQARADAVKTAMEEAKQLADAAGVNLGAIRSIDETDRDVPSPYQESFSADAANTRAPIEPGSQELSVDVVVVFEIDRG